MWPWKKPHTETTLPKGTKVWLYKQGREGEIVRRFSEDEYMIRLYTADGQWDTTDIFKETDFTPL